MKTVNKIYRKHDGKFARRSNAPMWLGALFVIILFYIYICYLFRPNLVSPNAYLSVKPVYAKEIVRCELGVSEYLECMAIQGVITHKEAEIMTAIAKAESGMRETAKSKKSSAKGVFQILSGSTWYDYGCKGEIYEWKDNTNCAIKIMKRSGFTPWEVFNTKSYIKFLNK